MRILYVATKYDYGNRDQGYSFEHCNMFDCLHHMGHDIIYFDFMTLLQDHGRDWMNQRLWQVAKAEQADLMFTFLALDELSQRVIRDISERTDTVTFNWFADDHWRFDNFSCYWAPCFNWVSTTAQSAVPKYETLGYRHVIKTQWASNPFLYRKLDLPLKYDVTFIGQVHGNRRQVVASLRDAGLDVRCWGTGWDTGRLGQPQMIEVFNQSRINLNLTNASVTTQPTKPPPRAADGAAAPPPTMAAVEGVPTSVNGEVASGAGAGSLLRRSLHALPGGPRLKSALRRRLAPVGHAKAARTTNTAEPQAPPPAGDDDYAKQIKGRNFEVPGCGGFLLTGPAENLEEYYEIGREVVSFTDLDNLIERAHYYLAHEDERAAIADVGYRRTRGEHTYVHRFTDIFHRLGLPCAPVEPLLSGQAQPGSVQEIT